MKMDILKPQLIWIEGRCYRKNYIEKKLINPEEKDDYLDFTDEIDTCEDYEENIEEFSDGKLKISVSVPNAFFSHVIGTKGNTKKRIENETKCRIFVPLPGHTGDVVITGIEKRGISSAVRRIRLLIANVRQKTAATHFLCLPLNIQQLQHSFLDFKDDVLRNFSSEKSIDSTLFQKPEKLHLTIGMLVLMDDNERKAAAKILEECQEEIIRPLLQGKPLEVVIEGIEYMNDDPGAVDVLYAKVKSSDGSDRLQVLAQKLLEKFVSSGYMLPEYEKVKLHITLMNTYFRAKSSADVIINKRNRIPRETFNATQILKEFGNYKFATVKIPSIHISVLHSISENGFYVCSSSVKLM